MKVEALMLAILLVGCRPDPVHPTGEEALSSMRGTSLGTINGRTITAEEAVIFAQTSPDATVEGLVARELLVQEAVRSGKDVELARKRAMVRALIEDEIEQKIGVEEVPADRMAKEIAAAEAELAGIAGFEVSALRVGAKPLFSKTPPTDPEVVARLNQQARDEIRRLMTLIPDTDAVSAIEAIEPGQRDGLIIDISHDTKILASSEQRRPKGWQVSPALAQQVANLQDGARSTIVEAPRTVMFVVRRRAIEPDPADPAEVRELATQRALTTTRRERLEQYIEQLVAVAPVAIHPDVLEAL